jgi:hypothetical protein
MPGGHSQGGCQVQGGDLIFGHVPFDPIGAASVLSHRYSTSMYFMIFLRDPVDRLVSFANFMQVPSKQFPTWWRPHATNLQTSMVNGIGAGKVPGDDPNDARSCAFDKFQSSPAASYLLRSADNTPQAAEAHYRSTFAVQHALVALEKAFTFVGDTGDFAGSLWLLQRTFRWGEELALATLMHGSRIEFTNENTAGPNKQWARWTPSDLPPALRADLSYAEGCDQALYNFAKGLVEQRLAVMPPADVPALAAFRIRASSGQ